MKRQAVLSLLITLIIASLPCFLDASDMVLNNAPAKVYFSPDGGATKGIVRQIDQATREILVQIYLFTSKPIQSALLRAQKRGVNVEIIMDRDEQKERKYVMARSLKAGGITVWLDDRHACAHNKVMIIDRDILITGSFNYTYAADSKNAENVLMIKSQDLAGIYTDNFLKHRQHSRKY